MKKTLQDLINILALPNMWDEGRKATLIAIKAWQIEFQAEMYQRITYLEELTKTKKIDTFNLRYFAKEVLGEQQQKCQIKKSK